MSQPTNFPAPRKGSENTGVTHAIVEHVRGRIVRGELMPGERLAPRSELGAFFGTTKLTVQRAFDVLTENGFVVAQGARGTFVAPYPPHLWRYGLVFPDRPFRGVWSKFYESLRAEAARIEATQNRKIPIYYDVTSHFDGPDSAPLLREMQNGQLAGVIFASNPESLGNAPLLQVLDVPMAAIMSRANQLGVPVVTHDVDSFFEQAIAYLAAAGCRRIASINVPIPTITHREFFFDAVTRHGLATLPYWWLPMPQGQEEAQLVRTYTRLLVGADPSQRPDGLIVSDDNLLPHVMDGLGDAGIRVPDNMVVIAQANFPLANSAFDQLPMLGFSGSEILATCIELIDRQRRNEIVPSVTPHRPIFRASSSPEAVVRQR